MAGNDKRQNWLIILVLALGTVALYSPLFVYGFVNFDDPNYVANNFHISQGFSWHALAWCFQAGYCSNWHPLTWMSHLLDFQVFGSRPGGHHATSVLLHTGNSVLLFLVLLRLTGARWRSALVAGFFAWHPLHVESVAWISERKDVLSTWFWLLTMLAYINYVERRTWFRYLQVLLCFTFGLMSKQMLVTLPFVLLLIDWWPLRRFQAQPPTSAPIKAWRIIAEKLPFIPLIIGASVLTFIAQKRGGAVSTLERTPWLTRLFTADVSYFRYLIKLVWPHNMAVIYPYEFSFARWEVITGAGVLLTVSVAAILTRKTRPYLLLGWLWYLGTLVPVIGFVQIGAQSMADRYSYIPSIGIFVMVVWGAGNLLGRWPILGTADESPVPNWLFVRKFLAGAGLVLVGISAMATSIQLSYWYDGGTLFTHSIAVTQDNFIAHSSYAAYLRDHGELEKARIEAVASVELAPGYAAAHNFLGEILMRQNKLDEAIEHLQMAKKLRPDLPEPDRDLGSIYLRKNQPEAALAEFAIAAKIEPEEPTIHFFIGTTLLDQGKIEEAKAELTEAVRLAPNYAQAHNKLGSILSGQRQTAEAIRHFRESIKYVPDNPEALNNLAWILTADPDPKYRSGAEAVQFATRACELTQNKEPLLIGTLAAAYAETGKFTEAEAAAKRARDLAKTLGNKAIVAKNEELMALYRSHQAYHETNSPLNQVK